MAAGSRIRSLSFLLPFLALLGSSLLAGEKIPIPREIPFELWSNKPFVQVRVNGSEPLWFILDTGCRGGFVLERERARALGLKIENERQVQAGAGEGVRIPFGNASGVRIEFAGEILRNQAVSVIPFAHVDAFEGRKIEGLVGQALFHRYVVEIDYDAKKLRLHEPALFTYEGPGRWIPLLLDEGFACVRARLHLPDREAVQAKLVVDTGARTALLFNRPFAQKNHIVQSVDPLLPATIGGGMGGESCGLVGRVPALDVGPFRLPEPVAIFSLDRTGFLAGAGFDGILGGGVLKRCRVIFDFFGKRMLLEPHGKGPAGYVYDRSGLFLVAEGPRFRSFRVLSVMAGSPAALAGLRRDDRIRGVDGKPAAEYTLRELRALFLLEGKTYRLEMERDGRVFTVEIRTRTIV